MKKTDERLESVLRHLRSDARAKLTEISARTGMPVSTVHQKLHDHHGTVTQHTTLVDWNALGFERSVSTLLSMKAATLGLCLP